MQEKHQIGTVSLSGEEILHPPQRLQVVDHVDVDKDSPLKEAKLSASEQFFLKTGLQPLDITVGGKPCLGFRDYRLHLKAGKPPISGKREMARRIRQAQKPD